MADANCRCVHCDANIPPRLKLNGEPNKNAKRYCSPECRDAVRGARPRLSKPRLIYCQHCHCECVRRVRGGDADSGKYCDRSCAAARRSLVAQELAGVKRLGSVPPPAGETKPQSIGKLVRVLKKVAAEKVRMERRAERAARPCAVCGAPCGGEPSRGRGKLYCGRACARKSAKATVSRAQWRRSESGRAFKRSDRQMRKAMKRTAVVERVNDIAVLERDKWRCQLCGVKTPKKLRGTYEPNAPEVDHIIPLGGGYGGEHSYRNLQCLCRSCNARKGASIKGQLLLIG